MFGYWRIERFLDEQDINTEIGCMIRWGGGGNAERGCGVLPPPVVHDDAVPDRVFFLADRHQLLLSCNER